MPQMPHFVDLPRVPRLVSHRLALALPFNGCYVGAKPFMNPKKMTIVASGAVFLVLAASCALLISMIGSGCSRPANALVGAARRGDTNRVAKLIAKGVPIDSVEIGMLRQTALAAAAGYGDEPMVKFLLRNGADPNLKSGQFGTTPLIEAIGLGDPNLPVIRMLINGGADPNLADSRGNRPLNYARVTEKGILTLLESKGAVRKPNANADTNVTNGNWKSIPFKVKLSNPK